MPEKLPTRTVARFSRHLAKGLLCLVAVYALVTELQPYGIDYGSTSLDCELVVREYAAAVEQYQARTGRLPLSLEQLVPLTMPEHQACSGSSRGPRPMTRLGIRAFLMGQFEQAPTPQRPDYSFVQRPDGTVTYELLCNRDHSARTGYRGDSGAFLADIHTP